MEIGVRISRILIVIVLFQICQVVFTGALRGAGDVVYTMISSTISVTFVRTAVSYICCYIVGWGNLRNLDGYRSGSVLPSDAKRQYGSGAENG